ncbi:MAG TPA: diacylglycerol kinase family protein [Candidatus Angelobacter sp.]|nr:diacylglycerol kinase family protein [Candidatus Angelobacter sp.]
MHKAFLIYNPASGRRRERRAEKISRAAEVLRAAGVQAEISATTGKGSAIQQTQHAAAQGFDTIIACGGDGTVNEVLNGLMLSSAPATLGVIPLGSGNLMATDLDLPRDCEAAARRLLNYQPREIKPGVITYQSRAGQQKRWFVVAAGVGADAELMYRTAVGVKERYGMYAYFAEMARMAWRGHFPMFNVEWQNEPEAQGEAGQRRQASVALVMAVRANRFPAVMRLVRLGCELTQNRYRLMLFRTDKVFPFINFFFSVVTGRNWKVKQVDLADSTWFRCTPQSTVASAIHCEADGENLGKLPVEVSIDQRTFSLLMPPMNKNAEVSP